MEDTMHTGERIIVSRLPNTWSQITNQAYQPKRGQVIVFENPRHNSDKSQEYYLVKRVIAFGGERVVIQDGKITVYNNDHPDGLNPDDNLKDTPRSPTSGDIDMIVPNETVFVVGDHRDGNNSHDSRNGLGTVPVYDIIGPVSFRWWPLHKMRLF